MNNKKIGMYLMSAILITSMAACTPSSNVVDNSDTTTTDIVEVVPEEDEEPVVEEVVDDFAGKYVKPGDEITMEIGDVIRVEGDDEYELTLVNVSEVNGKKRAEFKELYKDNELTLIWWKNTESMKEDFGIDEDYSEYYGSFQSYPMTVTSVGNFDVVFTIADKVIVPEPIEFSGNAEDIYNSSEFNYIVTDHCYIYIDNDINVPENFGVAVEDCIASLEELTGYEFKREGAYNESFTFNTANLYLGNDPWYGVNADNSKIDVYIFTSLEGMGRVSNSSGNEVVYVTGQIFTKDNKINIPVVAHELTHVLTQYHLGNLNSIMTEGAAEFYSVKVSEQLQEKYELESTRNENSAGFINNLANAKDPEAIFNSDYKDEGGTLTSLPYQYGYALNAYLYENCSENYLHEFQEKINDGRFWYEVPEAGVEASKLKELYGDSLFKDFQKWYKANAKRFQ